MKSFAELLIVIVAIAGLVYLFNQQHNISSSLVDNSMDSLKVSTNTGYLQQYYTCISQGYKIYKAGKEIKSPTITTKTKMHFDDTLKIIYIDKE